MSDPASAQSVDGLKTALITYISSGEFVPGLKLPGELALMQMFGVGRYMLRQALDELRADGVIETAKGSGSRILQPRPVYAELRTRADQDTLIEPIGEMVTSRDEIRKDLAGIFGIPAGDPIFYAEQLGRHRVTNVRVLLSRTIPAESLLGMGPHPDPVGPRTPLLAALTRHHGMLAIRERNRHVADPDAGTLGMLGAESGQQLSELRRSYRTKRGRLLMIETRTSVAGAIETEYEL